MLKKLFKQFSQPRRVLGLEIILQSENKFSMNGVLVRIENNRAIKEKEFHSITTIQDLTDKVRKKLSLALSISGKGVLTKQINSNPQLLNPLEKIFPGSKPDEFYWQVINSGNSEFVSIIRRDILSKLFTKFKDNGYLVLSLSLAFNSLKIVKDQINFESGTVIKTPTFEIELNKEKEIINFSNKPTELNLLKRVEYNFGNQYISSPFLIPFSSAIDLLVTFPSSSSNLNCYPSVLQEIASFKNGKRLKFATLFFGIILLVALLTNLVLYNHLRDKVFTLTNKMIVSNELSQQAKILQMDIDKKDQLLMMSGWSGPSNISFYADRIASVVPERVQLSKLSIYPIVNNSYESNVLPNIKRDTILLVGICEDPNDLNFFENRLKNLQVFKSINVIKYVFDKDKMKGVFDMQISTK